MLLAGDTTWPLASRMADRRV